MASSNQISIAPKSFAMYENAVLDAGGNLRPLDGDTKALIWTDYRDPEGLAEVLRTHPQLEWVQLPFAGVDAFAHLLDHPVRFTSAKGSYREPVAEHALALSLALARKLPIRIKAASWGKREAVSFYDSNVLIFGGGGIAEELVKLFAPFRAEITVVRNQSEKELKGAHVVGIEKLGESLTQADLVIIAAALTEQTRGLFNFALLSKMRKEAFLVNVARGPIVVTSDLLRALDEEVIAGAGVDVTDPEPLPDGHPMFLRDDLVVTPHTADTKEIVERLFALRIKENVAAFLGRGQWVGEVDPALGY